MDNECAKHEDELRKLSIAIEHGPAMLIITDRHGNITYVNHKFSQVTGYSPEEVVGRNARILKSGEQPREFYEKLWSTILSGKEWRGQFHNRKKNGELYWEHASISPIVDAKGAISGFVAVKEDITTHRKLEDELKLTNEKLKRLDQLKADFIATVSHELRTPMTTMREGVSQILDGLHGQIQEPQKRILSVARDNVDRLVCIVANLLDISKIEAGKLEVKKELVDIVTVAKEAKFAFAQIIESKGLRLTEDFPKNKVEAYADRDKLAQVFTNLLSNAVKFTEKGSIAISVVEKEAVIACSVSDTGIGISAADQGCLFMKLEQFGRPGDPISKGSGLGLSITKGIIDLHNGKIWMDSQAGKGTTFHFTLPKHTPEVIFREYLTRGIRQAAQRAVNICLITIYIEDFSRVKKEMDQAQIGAFISGIEAALKKTLRRSGDVVIKDAGEAAVILTDCDKMTASRVQGRLEEAVEEYLRQMGLEEKIKLTFGMASYPEDAKNYDELLKKVKIE